MKKEKKKKERKRKMKNEKKKEILYNDAIIIRVNGHSIMTYLFDRCNTHIYIYRYIHV